jgi:hypothetical protein
MCFCVCLSVTYYQLLNYLPDLQKPQKFNFSYIKLPKSGAFHVNVLGECYNLLIDLNKFLPVSERFGLQIDI